MNLFFGIFHFLSKSLLSCSFLIFVIVLQRACCQNCTNLFLQTFVFTVYSSWEPNTNFNGRTEMRIAGLQLSSSPFLRQINVPKRATRTLVIERPYLRLALQLFLSSNTPVYTSYNLKRYAKHKRIQLGGQR